MKNNELFPLKVTSRYLRAHNCLLVDSNMDDYLIDYYLNAKEMGLNMEPEQDEQLKQYIAALAIHLTTKPPEESIAWTVHMQAKTPYSLFLTGSSSARYLVGRVLTDSVVPTDLNTLHSQVVRAKGEPSRSTICCEVSDAPSVFEMFYKQSEQLGAKLRIIENSDRAVALFALPGFDEDWFEKAEPEDVLSQIETFNYRVMNQAEFLFLCDCSPEKLMPFFNTIGKEELIELYGSEQVLRINCPRCGKSFTINKSEVL